MSKPNRAYAAVTRFADHLEAEIEDAVHAARSRRLAAVREVEQLARYLYSRHPSSDQADGPPSKKPRGVAIEPDVILAIKAREGAPLAGCLRAIHDSILALEPYESVPFKRKPIGFRRATKSELTGPEETALAALDRAGQDLIGLLRGLAEQLATSRTTKANRRRKLAASLGVLTPPQVGERLGVSPDKVRGWIAKGELNATNVATGSDGRPRYRVSEKDLADFQEKRQPSKPPAPAPRRRKKDPNVTEFF